MQLELSYLQAAEQQWKTKKGKNTRQKSEETKPNKKEKQTKDGEKTELSPRVKKNSKVKSRIKGSEIERITKNAQTALVSLSSI